eukprot:g18588.t1
MAEQAQRADGLLLLLVLMFLWCHENNLSLNVSKTKRLIIDFRRKGGRHTPIYIDRAEVKRIESIKYLGVTINNNLPPTSYIDATVKNAEQRLFFLRQLRKFGMSARTFTNVYRCTIESMLSGCITA